MKKIAPKVAESDVEICAEWFEDVYNVESELGRGKFAVVKRCVHKQSGVDYAAKFVHKRRMGRDCRQAALQEVSMLRLARVHPRIVDIVEVYENRHELVIVTEYARGGELFNHIDVEGPIEEKCAVRLMRQILDGLDFLHSNNILHLDIKPQNILLTERLPDGNIKLCDLGLARSFNSGEDIIEIIGTPDYVAPEVLDYEPLCTASDMWSVGVLAYVMLSGCSPFAGDTKQETFLNISQVNLSFPDEHFSSISSTAIDFIRTLLVSDPSERPSARQCLEHSWLRENDTDINLLKDTAISAAAEPASSLSCTSSPLGQRRALQSPGSVHEPVKKCKCNNDSDVPADIHDSKQLIDNARDSVPDNVLAEAGVLMNGAEAAKYSSSAVESQVVMQTSFDLVDSRSCDVSQTSTYSNDYDKENDSPSSTVHKLQSVCEQHFCGSSTADSTALVVGENTDVSSQGDIHDLHSPSELDVLQKIAVFERFLTDTSKHRNVRCNGTSSTVECTINKESAEVMV